MNTEVKTKTSEATPVRSFSSLPDEIVLNCLARVSRIHYPTLSLVSKTFRTILSSRELYATRTLIQKTEDILYVCLKLSNQNPNSRWFALSLVPKQQEMIPMPSFPSLHDSTVISTGSEIYIIGGFFNGNKSRRVLVLDIQSHQWRRLPDMLEARIHPGADVIDGKIYVFGGCFGGGFYREVYDVKTQTWEPLLETELALTFVIGGQVYSKYGARFNSRPRHCLMKLENVLYQIHTGDGKLYWCDPKEDVRSRVLGLEELSSKHLVSVENPSGGRRVTIWWKTVMVLRRGGHYTKECETNIWCAEISFERRSSRKLWGLVEWSRSVFLFDGCDFGSGIVLDSATTVTH